MDTTEYDELLSLVTTTNHELSFFRQSVHTGDNVELDTFDAFDFVTKVEHVQLVRLYQKEGETVDLLSNVCSGIDKEGQGAQSLNRLCTKNF